MTSTFHGLEVARRALFTQQSALHTTGHNISNANTEGYSRQRVNFEATSPFPTPGRNRPEMPGQLGTGVTAADIERVRDEFLDYQYRTENTKSGYWTERSSALSRMENIMNEPSESGLGEAMNQFWNSIQDVATNPEDGGARKVMQQRGVALADTMNYLHNSLSDVQGELKNQMDTGAKEVNALLTQIGDLNAQIARVEPNGYLPNDLYDKRDQLVDQLSEFVNVDVSYESNGGHSKSSAMGQAVITLVDNNGNDMTTGGNPVELINGDNELKGFSFEYSDENVSGVSVGDLNDGEVTNTDTIAAADFTSTGALQGLMHANGYVDENGDIKGDYADMISDLNTLAYEFATEFNNIHQSGYDLNGDAGVAFFDTTGLDATNAAANLDLTDSLKNNENLIAASNEPGGVAGNGENALDLANIKDYSSGNLDGNSVSKFYEGMIGELGVKAQEANRLVNNSEGLKQSVENSRQSVSGVSLDEEMSNMIKFQHAYNAAARNMTAVDEMLDRIINQMGIVGR
ncbi:flagellar hook-associated protein FlgK [Halalkalibacillus sediminis]|uniref:Flagellar hook-associated protein 1 n=1 Tax=Halalkalibacillus sediminis TaxID=2018042 RepID=A0A2I0QUG1_9BACI|nr:flagellar hook-associated protein FlgK [Halalkalibacillus sediminis]PKR77983.1 flagellar hook-associated protein FlgK [Halalkalibacillus sediminis]